MTQMHASCVAFADRAILLRGPSGSGKSDLALRLIEAGGQLVADDYVDLEVTNGILMAGPPETIAGRIEARGIGLLALPFQAPVPVRLLVDLVPRNAVERLPEAEYENIEAVAIRRLALYAFDGATVAKLKMFLASL
jgi:HPr kinase/phosphorylase